jgi:hypothetical protein
VESHLAPVDGEDGLLVGVTHRWHLEWEEVLGLVAPLLLHALFEATGLSVDLKGIIITQELAVEPSNDKNLIFGELADTCTLPGCDWDLFRIVVLGIVHVHLRPLGLLDI